MRSATKRGSVKLTRLFIRVKARVFVFMAVGILSSPVLIGLSKYFESNIDLQRNLFMMGFLFPFALIILIPIIFKKKSDISA